MATPKDNDSRTGADLREALIAQLIKSGMPPDIAPRAVDSWLSLLSSSPAFADKHFGECGDWIQYAFLQGFVAGSISSVHHN